MIAPWWPIRLSTAKSISSKESKGAGGMDRTFLDLNPSWLIRIWIFDVSHFVISGITLSRSILHFLGGLYF